MSDRLFEAAPELAIVNDLACRFVTILKGKDIAALDRWLDEARRSDLTSFASGLDRDIEAVRAAVAQPWTTSPVEGQINRFKTIKRQIAARQSGCKPYCLIHRCSWIPGLLASS